jgi:hypothetical protein
MINIVREEQKIAVALKMLLIGCDKLLNRLSQAFETLRSIVFDRLKHNFFCVPQAISFFNALESDVNTACFFPSTLLRYQTSVTSVMF